MVKEFMLITMMTNPMIYTDQKLCEEAAEKLLQHDTTAVCIPAGKQQPDIWGQTLDLIIKLESLEVDSKNK